MRDFIITELGEVAFEGESIEVLGKHDFVWEPIIECEIVKVDLPDADIRRKGSSKVETVQDCTLRRANVYSDKRNTLIGRYKVPNLPASVASPYNYRGIAKWDLNLAADNSYIFNVDRGISIKPTDQSERTNVFVGDTVVVELATSVADFRFGDYFDVNDYSKCEPLTVVDVYYNSEGRLVVEFCSERAKSLNGKHIKAYGDCLHIVRVLDVENNKNDRDFVFNKCQSGVVQSYLEKSMTKTPFSSTSSF